MGNLNSTTDDDDEPPTPPARRALTSGFCASPERSRGRLRILCLHGYASNNDITQLQLASLRLETAHACCCDMLEATTEEPWTGMFNGLGEFSSRPFYSWFSVAAARFQRKTIGAPGGPLHSSLLHVMQHVAAHGPYDGVYGFSQGALLASYLCASAVWHNLFGLSACPFQFIICANAAGALSYPVAQAHPAHAPPREIELPIPLPSFHLIGRLDYLHRSSSQSISAAYASALATVYTHEAGHELPALLSHDAELAQLLGRFLSGFRPTSQRDGAGAAAGESIARAADAAGDARRGIISAMRATPLLAASSASASASAAGGEEASPAPPVARVLEMQAEARERAQRRDKDAQLARRESEAAAQARAGELVSERAIAGVREGTRGADGAEHAGPPARGAGRRVDGETRAQLVAALRENPRDAELRGNPTSPGG